MKLPPDLPDFNVFEDAHEEPPLWLPIVFFLSAVFWVSVYFGVRGL